MVSINSTKDTSNSAIRICPNCGKPLTGDILFYFKDGYPSSKEIVYCQNCGFRGEV